MNKNPASRASETNFFCTRSRAKRDFPRVQIIFNSHENVNRKLIFLGITRSSVLYIEDAYQISGECHS